MLEKRDLYSNFIDHSDTTMAFEKKERGNRRGRGRRNNKPKKEFDEVLLEVRRVTRVTTWWRQLSFRAIILIWNKKGKIGLWVAKWSDVAVAVQKATREAYKNIIDAPVTETDSVPYELTHKYKSAVVKLIPASSGTWLKAWSSVRRVLELAGYNNILSKIMGTNNKLNNAIATLQALGLYKQWKLQSRNDKRKAKAEATSSESAWNETAE